MNPRHTDSFPVLAADLRGCLNREHGAFQIDRLPPDHDPGEMLLVPFVQRFEC